MQHRPKLLAQLAILHQVHEIDLCLFQFYVGL